MYDHNYDSYDDYNEKKELMDPKYNHQRSYCNYDSIIEDLDEEAEELADFDLKRELDDLNFSEAILKPSEDIKNKLSILDKQKQEMSDFVSKTQKDLASIKSETEILEKRVAALDIEMKRARSNFNVVTTINRDKDKLIAKNLREQELKMLLDAQIKNLSDVDDGRQMINTNFNLQRNKYWSTEKFRNKVTPLKNKFIVYAKIRHANKLKKIHLQKEYMKAEKALKEVCETMKDSEEMYWNAFENYVSAHKEINEINEIKEIPENL